jgi:rfaE bifunctional protein kinase chain/domain
MDVDALFDRFAEQRILVVGDVMIDAYLRGAVSRVSPEAPVPIVNLKKSESRLGGAANVALNLASLGATPILCGAVGDDAGGETFYELLEQRGLSSEGMIKSSDRFTTIKTRVIGNNQHLLRIDEEEKTPISESLEDQIVAKVKAMIASGIDAIILEDYNKGLLTPAVITGIVELATASNIPVTVDPKKDNFFVYKNVTLFKPNLKELKEGLAVDFDLKTDRDGFEAAVIALEKSLNNRITLVTLSEHGVFIKAGKELNYIPAHIRNISDVSGAGDTVIAVATLCLVAGLSASELADIANLSGGLVCERSGVVPIDKQQLKEELLKLMTA